MSNSPGRVGELRTGGAGHPGAVRAHAAAEGLPEVGVADFVTTRFPIHLVERDGREVALVEAPIGAPAAVMVAEYLRQRGVRTAVAVGSCGTLRPFEAGEFFVPARALRAEGTSHHYLPAAESVGTDPQVRAACIAAIEARGHPAVEVTTWTTDGFYRETPAMIDRRLGQGCSVVEMECAAWAAWAQYRGVRFGQILFTADSLAGGSRPARLGHRFARGRAADGDRRGLHGAGLSMALQVALTGGIASGKTTVAALFAERGALLIDSDQLAREVVEPGTPGLAEVVARFGGQVLDDQGRLDRQALGAIVFADDVARADLNAIVHPGAAARAELLAEAGDDEVVISVIPLLVETGLADQFDAVVVVDLPRRCRSSG